MNGLMGFVLFSAAMSLYGMNSDKEPDFTKLQCIVNEIKAGRGEKYGFTPLMIRVCKGEFEDVKRLVNEQTNTMFEKAEGLFPIHWAIIARHDDIRAWLETKDRRNLELKTAFNGLTAFGLQIKLDTWYRDQEKKRAEAGRELQPY